MQSQLQQWIVYLWYGVAAVWLGWALFAKKTERMQAPQSRAAHLVVLGIAFVLLFIPPAGIGPLGWRIVPDTLVASEAGLALTILGVLIAVWARVALGSNWSGSVTIKQDHELVRRGPYALVRHPIYTGLLTSMLGTAIAFGALPCFLAVIIATAACWVKLRMEERFLEEQFGPAYAAYKRDVKALIPFVL